MELKDVCWKAPRTSRETIVIQWYDILKLNVWLSGRFSDDIRWLLFYWMFMDVWGAARFWWSLPPWTERIFRIDFVDESCSSLLMKLKLFFSDFHEPPKPWKIKVFGHQKTRSFTIKTLKTSCGRFWGLLVISVTAVALAGFKFAFVGPRSNLEGMRTMYLGVWWCLHRWDVGGKEMDALPILAAGPFLMKLPFDIDHLGWMVPEIMEI